MGKQNNGPRPMGVMSALLAFALSAVMGLAFVMVVNKTHDLFSSTAFTEGLPNVTALKAQIASNVRYLRFQI
jgi:hypothetical protein